MVQPGQLPPAALCEFVALPRRAQRGLLRPRLDQPKAFELRENRVDRALVGEQPFDLAEPADDVIPIRGPAVDRPEHTQLEHSLAELCHPVVIEIPGHVIGLYLHRFRRSRPDATFHRAHAPAMAAPCGGVHRYLVLRGTASASAGCSGRPTSWAAPCGGARRYLVLRGTGAASSHGIEQRGAFGGCIPGAVTDPSVDSEGAGVAGRGHAQGRAVGGGWFAAPRDSVWSTVDEPVRGRCGSRGLSQQSRRQRSA